MFETSGSDLVPKTRKYSVNLHHVFLYILSISVLLRFDYLFGGANRFIPFRIIILFSLVYLLYVILHYKKIDMSRVDVYFFICFITLFTLFHFFWFKYAMNLGAFIRNFLHFTYILAGFFLTKYLVSKISDRQFQHLLKTIILGAIIIVGFETIVRFLYPTLDLNSENTDYLISIYSGAQEGLSFDTFYFFKMSSIMFFDSNYVGSFLLVFLSLNTIVKYDSKTIKILSFVAIYVLIFLTLSRAAIFTSSLLFLLWMFLKLPLRYKPFFLSFLGFVTLIGFIAYGTNLTISDGSLLTKFEIFNSLSRFFNQDIFISLFGMGYEIGGYLYSYMSGGYAHVHLAILLGEIGLLGILIYLGYWAWIYKHIGMKMLLVFIPFFIVGFSLADPWEISYFWSCGLLYKVR